MCLFYSPFCQSFRHDLSYLEAVHLQVWQRHLGEADANALVTNTPQLHHPQLLVVAGHVEDVAGVGVGVPGEQLHVVRVLTGVVDVLLKYFSPVHRGCSRVFPPQLIIATGLGRRRHTWTGATPGTVLLPLVTVMLSWRRAQESVLAH